MPGGIVAFHEPDWSAVRSSPPAPTHDRCCQWIREALDRATLLGHGRPPTQRLHRCRATGTDVDHADLHRAGVRRVWLQALADLVETLLPTIQAQGVATATEVGIETLTQRLLEEVSDLGATVIGRSEVGAWTAPRTAASTATRTGRSRQPPARFALA
ncbi:hypothetical protein I551_8963 [Mycobacterium ulcerans str. Harvey]|uniref:Uncharacterized protein n=1 Tax=Mycobacterium ulcerans str. Harvey TaxID=1299332 RepID=A0ABN0RA41_MYCUL|nr:hypothetical protein I551_8963 [Mycobacterium ulcerans str. Harvey]